jgi:hypothetical protein
MADYFLVHDAEFLDGRLRPELGEAWRRRSFGPCRALCADLRAAAEDYASRYHLGDEPLLLRAQSGLTFDRAVWRALVGEALLFAALEVPELPANADALCRLLGGEGGAERGQWPPIRQVLFGARDLTLGGAVYRPERAGLNAPADVARLAGFLEEVRPEAWSADDLLGLPDLADAEDRADELAYVREWFPVLVDLYRRSAAAGRALVLEQAY